PQRLVDGDAHQQLGQVVLVGDLEAAFLEPAEEGAEHRLDDVLRIDATGQALADAPPRQGHEALHIGVEELASGLLVAAAAEVAEEAVHVGFSHRCTLLTGVCGPEVVLSPGIDSVVVNAKGLLHPFMLSQSEANATAIPRGFWWSVEAVLPGRGPAASQPDV